MPDQPTIEPKDLIKGDLCLLRDGFQATVFGRAKGVRICLQVNGDIGDSYIDRLANRINPDGTSTKIKITNPKHLKQLSTIKAAGF